MVISLVALLEHTKKMNNENWTNSVQNKRGIQKKVYHYTDNGVTRCNAVTSTTAQKVESSRLPANSLATRANQFPPHIPTILLH